MTVKNSMVTFDHTQTYVLGENVSKDFDFELLIRDEFGAIGKFNQRITINSVASTDDKGEISGTDCNNNSTTIDEEGGNSPCSAPDETDVANTAEVNNTSPIES